MKVLSRPSYLLAFMWHPYKRGPNRDPNLENYPFFNGKGRGSSRTPPPNAQKNARMENKVSNTVRHPSEKDPKRDLESTICSGLIPKPL